MRKLRPRQESAPKCPARSWGRIPGVRPHGRHGGPENAGESPCTRQQSGQVRCLVHPRETRSSAPGPNCRATHARAMCSGEDRKLVLHTVVKAQIPGSRLHRMKGLVGKGRLVTGTSAQECLCTAASRAAAGATLTAPESAPRVVLLTAGSTVPGTQ